jgi:hypothetical protein
MEFVRDHGSVLRSYRQALEMHSEWRLFPASDDHVPGEQLDTTDPPPSRRDGKWPSRSRSDPEPNRSPVRRGLGAGDADTWA